jgi:hypothetical protein
LKSEFFLAAGFAANGFDEVVGLEVILVGLYVLLVDLVGLYIG